MFESDRMGFSTYSEIRGDDQFRTLTSRFGTLGNTSYSLDLDYQHNDGVRPNNELSRLEWYSTIKQQLTPRDSVLLLSKYQDYHSGDNFQRFDQSNVRTNYAYDELERPTLAAGYHRQWSPGAHTLFLATRLEKEQRFSDTEADRLAVIKDTNGVVAPFPPQEFPFDISYRSEFEIYGAELNQILQRDRHSLVLGGSFQSGSFETSDRLALGAGFSTNPFYSVIFSNPPTERVTRESYERFSGYGYYTLEAHRNLHVTGGVAYDQVKFPENHRDSPIAPGATRRDQAGPKAALVWTPARNVTLRGAYSRALGGVSIDETYRLEPTQLAGFNQSLQTVISESLVGSISAPTIEIAGVALDAKLKSRTYFGIQAELLQSDVDREIGVYDFIVDVSNPLRPANRATTLQRLDYEERSIVTTLNRLISDEWSCGARYRFIRSELRTIHPALPTSTVFDSDRTERADLHRAELFALFNHPSGFFARADTAWYHQSNSRHPSEDFFQSNALFGYRFWDRRAELSFGMLNINDADYRLNPLTPYSELPRERTVVVRVKINL